MLVCDIKRPSELLRRHVARADVSSVASLHDVVKRLRVSSIGVVGSLRWSLIKVDVIDAETARTVVDLPHDGGVRKALPVRTGPHPRGDFCGDHDDLIARGELLQRLGLGYFLSGSVRIDIGGVEEIGAELEIERNTAQVVSGVRRSAGS